MGGNKGKQTLADFVYWQNYEPLETNLLGSQIRGFDFYLVHGAIFMLRKDHLIIERFSFTVDLNLVGK